MKTIIFILLFPLLLMAQQLNYTWGLTAAGASYGGAGIVYLDTTAATTNYFYVDLSDYYPIYDIFPQADTSGVNLNSSDRMFIGTLYVFFDNQGTGSPTTDSLAGILIQATPGVYGTTSRSIAGAKFGTAITLETVRQAGDYLAINGVYIKDAQKLFPPELVRFGINAPATSDTDCDDSTAVYWRFVYPEVIESEQVHIDKVD